MRVIISAASVSLSLNRCMERIELIHDIPCGKKSLLSCLTSAGDLVRGEQRGSVNLKIKQKQTCSHILLDFGKHSDLIFLLVRMTGVDVSDRNELE